MSSLRILRIIHDLQIGGVQRMMLRSARAMRERGIETDICCLNINTHRAADFEHAGFHVHLVPFKSRFDPIGLFNLRKILRHGRYDIAHSHMYAANMAVNIALLGIKNIRIVNMYHSTRPGSSPGQIRMITRTQKIPNRIIAVSESVKEALTNIGVAPSRIEIIYNGIEVPPVREHIPERSSTAPIHLLWAGRFVKQKRIWFLVDVIDACRKAGIPVHLDLVGDGPTRAKMERIVRERNLSDMVIFHEFSTDIKKYIRAADLFISASEREGFSNVLLEACATGRGMILSDIPPHRELAHDSSAGIIAGDFPEGWAAIIKQLSVDRTRIHTMSEAAFHLAGHYSIENTISQLITLYEQVLSLK